MKGNNPPSPVDKVGLPIFTYHPDPLATGSVRPGTERCACCGQVRGFIYAGPIYAASSDGTTLCPWCIADGTAAAKLDGTFSDDHPLARAGIPEAVIEEVTQRTPGYQSWQQDEWQTCCGDACEFHGDPMRAGLALADPTAVAQFLSATGWSPEQWQEFVSNYEPGGSPALYHFVCRGCKTSKYGWDSD